MTLLPEAYGKRTAFDPASYIGSVVNPRDTLNFEDDLDILPTVEHAEILASQALLRKQAVTPPVLPDSLSWVEFGVSRSYIESIVSLAQARGTKVIFLFMPFYTGPDGPREAAWLEQYGPLWNASFMKDDPQNYEDSAHSAASPRVKAMLSEWFADNISMALKEGSNK